MKAAVLERILRRMDAHPVLVDIGASVSPPAVWKPIAGRSVYVGFDPDLRAPRTETGREYYKRFLINEAVTPVADRPHMHFHLTRFPPCSSTLKPDASALSEYLFADLFAIEKEAEVPATPLDSALDRLGLPAADWMKIDSQGTDLRLFESLRPERRARVLALDIEPGLIDAYVGEDLFVEAHARLVRNGFWLSDLEVHGAPRFRRATLDRLQDGDPGFRLAAGSIKDSPGWVNARYLRTLPWLAQGDFGRRDYGLLWTFACLDGQFGFAADLLVEGERRFGEDDLSRIMLAETRKALRSRLTLRGRLRSFLRSR